VATWQGAGKRGTSVVPNNSRNAPDFGGVAEAVTRAANVRDFEHDGRERRGLCREVRRLRLALARALALNCTPRLPIMKNILAGLFVFIAANAFALDIITRDGKAYQDCAVKTVERDGVRVVHRDGTAFFDFDVLPSALQKQYGWTEEKSAARKAARAVEAEKQRVAAEAQRKQIEEARKAESEAAEAEAQHARIYAQNAASAARQEEERKRTVSEASEQREKDRQAHIQMIANLTVGLYLLCGFVLAFIPTWIARGKPQMGAVLFLNLISLLAGFGRVTEDRIMAAAVYVVASGVWITSFILALKPKPQKQPIINVTIAHAPEPRQIQARPIAATPRAIAKAPAPPHNP
jgi:hypothetical protein